MDPKEFIRKEIQAGKSQTEVAKKVGVSNATIYKILYMDTQLTMETIKKIARAYHKPFSFFVEEDGAEWIERGLSEKEKRFLAAFRSLDERRQERILETIEDMVLALRESHERGHPGNDSKGSNYG
ncbi:MAG TPA: helix-turn-helix transcriptional regulator [Geobacteraceae bacterium]